MFILLARALEPVEEPMPWWLSFAIILGIFFGGLILIPRITNAICKPDPEQLARTKDAPETVHVRLCGKITNSGMTTRAYVTIFETDDGRKIKIISKKRQRIMPEEYDSLGRPVRRAAVGMLTYQGDQLIAFEPDF